MDKDSLTALLAQGLSVEKIGKRFGKHPSTVSYWMDKYGLATPNREKHAGKGGIERERLEELVETGMTIAEIAVEVELSKTAVRHWLRRHGLKTRNKVGPRLEAGGRCLACGYDRCISALAFHHLDPSSKRLGISAGGLTLSLDTVRAETSKCVLLCSNCHAEVESGVLLVPVK
jgi:DNA-binding transcriptional ArsR family regulator